MNYGILVILLEAVLKSEIYSFEARLEAYSLIMKVLKSVESTNQINQMILFFFPSPIQEVAFSLMF